MGIVQPIVPLALGVLTLLVSAKAHGRELRLERELEGHDDIDFTRRNHPWVEALWARDRIRYWRIAAPLIALVALAAVLLRPAGWPWLLAAAPLVGMSVAFSVMGAWSLARRRAALNVRAPPTPQWVRTAARGSLLWWSLSGASALLVALALALR